MAWAGCPGEKAGKCAEQGLPPGLQWDNHSTTEFQNAEGQAQLLGIPRLQSPSKAPVIHSQCVPETRGPEVTYATHVPDNAHAPQTFGRY